MTLSEFLRARLDEKARRALGSGRVAWLTYRDVAGRMLYTTVASATIEAPDHWVVDGREPAQGVDLTVKVIYDEREVLAEVDAKRRIVDLHGPADDDPRYCRGCNADWLEEYAYRLDECPTKRLMALPYADHEAYDPAWRP